VEPQLVVELVRTVTKYEAPAAASPQFSGGGHKALHAGTIHVLQQTHIHDDRVVSLPQQVTEGSVEQSCVRKADDVLEAELHDSKSAAMDWRHHGYRQEVSFRVVTAVSGKGAANARKARSRPRVWFPPSRWSKAPLSALRNVRTLEATRLPSGSRH
jgi:hypothetical protein